MNQVHLYASWVDFSDTEQQDGPRELPVRSLALPWDPTVSRLSATVSNPDKLATAFHCGAKPQSQNSFALDVSDLS